MNRNNPYWAEDSLLLFAAARDRFIAIGYKRPIIGPVVKIEAAVRSIAESSLGLTIGASCLHQRASKTYTEVLIYEYKAGRGWWVRIAGLDTLTAPGEPETNRQAALHARSEADEPPGKVTPEEVEALKSVLQFKMVPPVEFKVIPLIASLVKVAPFITSSNFEINISPIFLSLITVPLSGLTNFIITVSSSKI